MKPGFMSLLSLHNDGPLSPAIKQLEHFTILLLEVWNVSVFTESMELQPNRTCIPDFISLP